MKAIYKYPMSLKDQWVSLPIGAKMLTVEIQNGVLCLWALVDPSEKIAARFFKVLGTGWNSNEIDDFDYVGTVFQDEFVWHIFVQRI
jgi:hypothetical protein